MKSITIFSLLAVFSINALAQNPNDGLVVYSGGVMRTMNIQDKKTETEGSFYYNEDWYLGTIELFSGEIIKNYPLKYDMKLNQIDIKVNEAVKIISIGAVKEITWKTVQGQMEVMRNTSVYKEYKGIGFFSMLVEGKVTLMKKTDLSLMESNYNVAMDAGSKSNKYIKKEKYYILKDNKINEIKKSKKKVEEILSDQITKIEEFVDANNLNLKEEVDLIRVFDYYNSL